MHIVLLNWNGWRDTVECLESVYRSTFRDYCVMVVDNGSEDDSIERIEAWARGEVPTTSRYLEDGPARRDSVHLVRRKREELDGREIGVGDLLLVDVGENLGFAAGCNVGIRHALATGADFVFLLNNDTVLDSEALQRLVGFLDEHGEMDVVTGQIRFYDEPQRIWNCGGELKWYGGRKYHYLHADVGRVPQVGFRAISFVTGCAAMFRTSLFKEIGNLSNRFFFGEEDFELAQRMKRVGRRMACRFDAVIYHKVSRAIRQATDGKGLRSVYLYYLNRFVDMRSFWPSGRWRIWRSLYFLYIATIVKRKHRISWAGLVRFRRELFRDSSALDGVDRGKFERVMRLGPWEETD